jgi:sirohydrochlorin cobaltochelatase
MDALLLIGHGSLKQASGASMIRLAALLRQRGVAPIATAAFLNFSKPTFQEGLERCFKKGATNIYVQPYFLIDGYYVHTALRKLVEEAKITYPQVNIKMSEPFGVHPVLAEIVVKRIQSVSETVDAVVMMAHGSPTPEANAPIFEIAKQVEETLGVTVRVAFMECNQPTIASVIDEFVQRGSQHIVATPYFLHLGSHVREDLPRIIEEARVRHPGQEIFLSEHLGFDVTISEIIEARINAVKDKQVTTQV